MKINFKLEEREPIQQRVNNVLPPGEHTFNIESFDMVICKKEPNEGVEMIKGTFEEIETGITVNKFFCVNHPGKTADFAQRQISDLFAYTKTSKKNADTDDLIGKKINAVTAHNKDGFTDIKFFRQCFVVEPVNEDQLPF